MYLKSPRLDGQPLCVKKKMVYRNQYSLPTLLSTKVERKSETLFFNGKSDITLECSYFLHEHKNNVGTRKSAPLSIISPASLQKLEKQCQTAPQHV